ncbi:peptidase membrane protein [Staphylococcus phage VB-SavM-JYL02]|uniref:Peptidase membrane protein n=2 Tax=Kayvirus P108 TaxID=1924731 RepID=A0A3T0IDY2_9CAUD|nr:peptidase membrane protein [Staphylococcus phage VB_SavM_JYL01]AZU97617.1 peptidase membrane protein [Staphylococcus phage VB-SavM-JYL02]
MVYDSIISRTMAVSILNKWIAELITDVDLDKCNFTEEEYGAVVTNSINKIQDVLIEKNYEVTDGELYDIVCTELINPIKNNTEEEQNEKDDLLEHLEDLAFKHDIDLGYVSDGSYNLTVTHWLMQDEFTDVNIKVNNDEDFYTVTIPESKYFWLPITKENLEMFLTQDPINKGEIE